MGRPAIDLTGQRFGRLTALRRVEPKGKKKEAWWLCECDCGETKRVAAKHLRDEHVRSCGCLLSEWGRVVGKIGAGGRATKHGMSDSAVYNSWSSMRTRCTNPKNHNYPRYGGRGIAICDRWQSFANFLADMGDRPAGKTLDRIDNNGNYSPSNCRWATPKEQRNNQSPRSQLAAGQMEAGKPGELEMMQGSLMHLSAKVKELDARLTQLEQKGG